MERSRFIAGLIGPVLILLSVSLLLNRDTFPAVATQVGANFIVVIMGGLAFFVAGLAIVRTHNVWFGWPVLVTGIGWLCVLSGGARLLFPMQIAEVAPRFTDQGWLTTIELSVFILLGLFFCYQAYLKKG
jgi:hypothetical protein